MNFVATITLVVLQTAADGPAEARADPDELLLELGHPATLEVVGADRLGADAVLQGLTRDQDFFEASLPSQRLEVYLNWLESVVATGYQHQGFGAVDVHASADREASRIEIAVTEGPQWLAAEVRLEGAQQFELDWLRAVLRAGNVNGVAREHFVVPEGPAYLEPPLPPDTGHSPHAEFWVPGEPAPVSEPDRLRMEFLAQAAAQAAGLLSAELSLRWDQAEAGAAIPTIVIREGPLHVIERVRFEGSFGDPPAQLEEWVALPAGTPATTAALGAAVGRLLATGRFGSAKARFDSIAGEPCAVELVLHAVEAPTVPPLEEHPFEDMRLMRRMLSRLRQEDSAYLGVDVTVTLSGERLRGFLAKAPLGFSIPVPADGSLSLHFSLLRSFLAIEVLVQRPKGEGEILFRLFEDGHTGFLSYPPAQLHLRFPTHEAFLIMNIDATYATPRVATDKTFTFGLSGGISSSGQGSALELVLDVTPAVLLYAYGVGAAPEPPDPGRLVRTATIDGTRIRGIIDREDASFQLEVDFGTDQVAVSFRFGDLQDISPPDWAADPGPSSSSASLDAVLAALGGSTPSEEGETRMAPERALLFTGLNALFTIAFSAVVDEPETGPAFVIPRVPSPERSTAEMRRLAERSVAWMTRSLPRKSWGVELLRTVPLLLFHESRDELVVARTVMATLDGRADFGPLGAWLAAELCVMGGQGHRAANLASTGLEDLSSAAFLADCENLHDLDAGIWGIAVAHAWRDLHARVQSDQAIPLAEAEREMLLGAFAGLETGDVDGAWLRAGLSRLWDASLRAPVEKRLRHLAAWNGGR